MVTDSVGSSDVCVQNGYAREWCDQHCPPIPQDSVLGGDALNLLKCIPPNSVDLIVTDPPYGLHFAKEDWDNIPKYREWAKQWAKKAWDVLKPGAYLLAMGSPRTIHQLTSGIEDAGFDIKDLLIWQYSQGFPKSYNISKGFDKKGIKKHDVVDAKVWLAQQVQKSGKPINQIEDELGFSFRNYLRTAHRRDDGWGNAFPTGEKWDAVKRVLGIGDTPFDAGLAEDAPRPKIRKGTAGLGNNNRLFSGYKANYYETAPATDLAKQWNGWGTSLKPAHEPIVLAQKPLDRSHNYNIQKWNIGGINIDRNRIPYTDEKDQAHNTEGLKRFAFAQGKQFTATRSDMSTATFTLHGNLDGNPKGRFPSNVIRTDPLNDGYDKYFLIPKPSSTEKHRGCEQGTKCNLHSTVKPVQLMKRLISLFSPQGALVVDPFLGSGTTAIAAKELCRHFIGIDLADTTVAKRRLAATPRRCKDA